MCLSCPLAAEALSQCRANLQRHSPRLSPDSLELIEAEYLAGVAEVRRRHPTATLCLLWLGSSVGNFAQDAAASLLHDLAAAAGGSMQLLLCTDLWKDRQVLHDAYDDSQGGGWGPAWLPWVAHKGQSFVVLVRSCDCAVRQARLTGRQDLPQRFRPVGRSVWVSDAAGGPLFGKGLER